MHREKLRNRARFGVISRRVDALPRCHRPGSQMASLRRCRSQDSPAMGPVHGTKSQRNREQAAKALLTIFPQHSGHSQQAHQLAHQVQQQGLHCYQPGRPQEAQAKCSQASSRQTGIHVFHFRTWHLLTLPSHSRNSVLCTLVAIQMAVQSHLLGCLQASRHTSVALVRAHHLRVMHLVLLARIAGTDAGALPLGVSRVPSFTSCTAATERRPFFLESVC
jgi:hypothetical protein